MEALQMLKFDFQYGRNLDFTASLRHEEELASLEDLTADAAQVPEDIPSFMDFLERAMFSDYD